MGILVILCTIYIRQGLVSHILVAVERGLSGDWLLLRTSTVQYDIKHSTARATDLLPALIIYGQEFIFTGRLLGSLE